MSVNRTRIDPHVKVLGEVGIDRAKRSGLDVIVYAPHFTRLPEIEKRAAEWSDRDITVLPAREIFTGAWHNRRHILAIGLSSPVPDFISLEAALAECCRQGASVLVPHPAFMSVSLSTAEMYEYLDAIDAIEVYNPKFLPWHTRRARALADDIGLPGFGSSYAHLPGTVGHVWTEVDAEIDSIEDLQSALEDDAFERVGRRTGWRHVSRRALEFSHLFWENSWSKFDRVFVQGTEPTHPTDPAYDGRFEVEAD